MWQTIGLVTSALTLIAFLAACLSSSLIRWSRRRYERDENLIAMAPEQDRAALIRQVGDHLNVNFDGIPERDRLPAVHAELENRRRRSAEREGTIRRIALLFAALAVIAIVATAVVSLIRNGSVSHVLWGEIAVDTANRYKAGQEILDRSDAQATSTEVKGAIDEFRPEFEFHSKQVENAVKRQSAPALREAIKGLMKSIYDSPLPDGMKLELEHKACGDMELLEEQRRKIRDSTG